MTPATLSRNKGTLTSFGSASTDKYVAPDLVLYGDASTIPTDEYYVDIYTGTVIKRIVDDDGNAVDWSGYSAHTADYAVINAGASTSYAAESITFAEDDIGYTPIGSTGEINLALGKNLHVNQGVFRDAIVLGTSTRITSTYASFLQAVALSPAFIEITSGTLDLTGFGNVSYLYIETATGDFTVRGIATPAKDGTVLILDNTTTRNMTIANGGSPGAGASAITTMTGASVVTSGQAIAMLVYNSAKSAWRLISYNG